jgi:restriction system protein
MPRRNESILMELTQAPWWMSVIAAIIVFVGMKFIVPAVLKGPLFSGLAKLSSSLAWVVACIFLLPGAISLFNAWRKGELFQRQTGLDSLSKLSWREFEEVIGEAYRRQGYAVIENAGPGADGGIDLIAKKEGETILVQCKQWKSEKIGVPTVREMFGLWNAERANEVHIVTCGDFTEEARQFAQGKPIKLIDGPSLARLINDTQERMVGKAAKHTMSKLPCPQCGSSMVLRTAKVGIHARNQFWGCERFPECKGIRLI